MSQGVLGNIETLGKVHDATHERSAKLLEELSFIIPNIQGRHVLRRYATDEANVAKRDVSRELPQLLALRPIAGDGQQCIRPPSLNQRERPQNTGYIIVRFKMPVDQECWPGVTSRTESDCTQINRIGHRP